MKHLFLFRKGLTQIGLVGMLVLMCAVIAQAQAPLVVPAGTTVTLNSSQAYSIITIEPGATLNVIGVGAVTTVIKVDRIEVQPSGKCIVKDAMLDLVGTARRIDVASGNNPNEGALLELTRAIVTSSSGGWDGIYVAGKGNWPANLQQNKTVGQAKFDGCKIEKSRNGICNYQSLNPSNGGGIIQVDNCGFVQNGTSLDFQNGLYTPNGPANPDKDSSYVIRSTFGEVGLYQGNFTTNPARAINANRVNGLRILGNYFGFSGPLPSVFVCGIIYNEAGIEVDDHCSSNAASTTNPCVGGTLTHSRFENLTYGVFRSGGNPNQRDVTISRSEFVHCRNAVEVAFTDRVKVSENVITLKQPGSGIAQTGIRLRQCSNFKLFSNAITTVNAASNSNTTGIIVQDMRPNAANLVFATAEKIEYNFIYNCSRAIYLYNNLVVDNGSSISPDIGMYVLCNYMSNSVSTAQDIVSQPGTGFPVNYYGIHSYHGRAVGGTGTDFASGNTFSNFPNSPLPQNFVYSGRGVHYLHKAGLNTAGFSGTFVFHVAPAANCNPPGSPPIARLAPNRDAQETPGIDESVLENAQIPVVAPNPSYDGIYRLTGFGEAHYIITDLFGRTLFSGNIASESATLDLSALTAGTYLLTVRAEGQAPTAYKLIRQ